ncbi:MAG: hypothetical protein FWD61_08115 [Phycisphaerales bacterium]|nr:hypothetical protein [Phycisphaerales bacterium]
MAWFTSLSVLGETKPPPGTQDQFYVSQVHLSCDWQSGNLRYCPTYFETLRDLTKRAGFPPDLAKNLHIAQTPPEIQQALAAFDAHAEASLK